MSNGDDNVWKFTSGILGAIIVALVGTVVALNQSNAGMETLIAKNYVTHQQVEDKLGPINTLGS